MNKPKLFSELCGEYKRLVAFLYNQGLLRDSSPYKSIPVGRKVNKVTWTGRNPANNVLYDTSKSCQEIISDLQACKQYSLLLYDKSIIQAEYILDDDNLTKSRLLFVKLQNKVWRKEELDELMNDPNNLDECLDEPIGFPIMIRMDYDPENHVECEHPKSHMTLNNLEECRIPLKAPLSLGSFAEFVFWQVYHIRTPDLKCVHFGQTITDLEKEMVHFYW